jgi:hypothetical protein
MPLHPNCLAVLPIPLDEVDRLAAAHRLEPEEAASILWLAAHETQGRHGCVPIRLLRRIASARCAGAGGQLCTFDPRDPMAPTATLADFADPLAVLEAQETLAGIAPEEIFKLDPREAALAAGRCARTARRWAARARAAEAQPGLF